MSTDADRQKILRQMKVRTTYKKDKSWIHQDNSEDERDEVPSPISPQRKSFDGKKLLWSTSPDSKTETNSGTFTAREVITSSSSPPVQSSNRQFSYSSNETNKSSSTSPPSSAPGAKVTPSYIIRGQPVNSVSQVKGPPSYNGYQKSYSSIQPRTSASLPRVPNATGQKMSTEEYKKLAPYNVRSRSADFSDEEPSGQEQPLDAEQTNRIMKSTPARDRSYVISAAKRTGGSNTQEATSPPLPFVAKKVQIHEEDDSANKKSQTLPKTLSSYLYDDYKKLESNMKEAPSKQTTSQTISHTAPSETGTDKSVGPKLTSFSTSNVVETKNATIRPEPARITVVRDGSNSEKSVSKPTAEIEPPTSTVTTRTERVENTKKSDALPESLASYLYNDVHSFEKSLKANQPTKSTSQIITTSDNSDKPVSKPTAKIEPPTSTVTTKTERVENTKKSDALPESLASYLYNDVHSFEKSWKSNQPAQPTSQTVTIRGTDRPESPKLTSWNTNTESKTSTVLPGPGKITVYRGENSETTDLSVPRLTSSNTETKGAILHSEPGKITVIKDESHDLQSPKPSVDIHSTTKTETKNTPDAVILTSSSLPTNVIESTKKIQTGPGKITILGDKRDGDNSQVSSKLTETTSTTTRPRVTIETITEGTSPKPAPRMETKTKEAAPVKASFNQEDLISWSDLDSNTDTSITKGKSVTPTPAPVQTTKDSYKQPTKPSVIPTADETKDNKARYRVTESLDEPGYDIFKNQSSPGTKRVTIATSETQPERPRTPELRSSSPRPTPRPRESVKTTGTESRYRVSENLEDTMLEAGPSRSGSRTVTTTRSSDPVYTEYMEGPDRSTRSSSRTTVTTTRSSDPVYTEYMEGADNRSSRTVSNSREKITTTTTTVETRHENSSSEEANQYDPQASNKGVLFVKEYVNSRESMTSPTTSGSFPDFSDDMERVSYNTSSSYLYSSPPERSEESPCSYCGRQIKDDCPKIILEHLNIHCHEYCFKCGICNKPMGDLMDSLFIHRDVVHCENCYEKLF